METNEEDFAWNVCPGCGLLPLQIIWDRQFHCICNPDGFLVPLFHPILDQVVSGKILAKNDGRLRKTIALGFAWLSTGMVAWRNDRSLLHNNCPYRNC